MSLVGGIRLGRGRDRQDRTERRSGWEGLLDWLFGGHVHIKTRSLILCSIKITHAANHEWMRKESVLSPAHPPVHVNWVTQMAGLQKYQ